MKLQQIVQWVLALLLCAVSLTACGPAAGNASEINVYTALEAEQVDTYLKVFAKAHPEIKVNIVRDSTGIVTAKLLAEKGNPQADVVWGTAASSLLVLKTQGMLEPYAPKGLDRVQTEFRDSANPPTWVGIDVWETAIVVNTVEAKKRNLPAVATYQDLLKPEFKGLVVMSNPASSGTGFLTVSALLQLKGEAEGWKYLDALHQNVAQYVHSGSKPAKMAAAGEAVIGVSFGYAGLSQKAKNAPVDVIFPSEGSGYDIEANALMKKASIKKAAKTFLDWAISDEIMVEYNKNYAIVAIKMPAGKLPEGYAKDPLAQLIRKNDFVWAATNRQAILDEWTKRYDAKSAPK